MDLNRVLPEGSVDPRDYNLSLCEDMHRLEVFLHKSIQTIRTGIIVPNGELEAFIEFISQSAVLHHATCQIRELRERDSYEIDALQKIVTVVRPLLHNCVPSNLNVAPSFDDLLLGRRMTDRILTALYPLRTEKGASPAELEQLETIVGAIKAINCGFLILNHLVHISCLD